MVSRKDPLPVSRQCELLDLPRSTFYYRPKPVPEADLALMRRSMNVIFNDHFMDLGAFGIGCKISDTH